jgi:O-antigen/teichoic acid export membrane protein
MTSTALAGTARLGRMLRPHADLLANSGSLIASSAVTSVLGFVFWWLAARAATPEVVGAISAAVSAMTFIGTIGVFGMGTLLISELPHLRTGRWNLISACLVAAGTVAAAGGLVYVVLVHATGSGLRETAGSPLAAGLLMVGVCVTAITLVLDDGLIGMLAGPLQLMRNTWFAAAKLLLLGLLAILPITVTGTEMLTTWVAGALLSIAALAVAVRRRGMGGSLRPHLAVLRRMRWRAIDHNLLNMALFLPRAALPLVVAVVLSTRATADFYAAWMVVTVLAMIPAHLATTLFAVAAGDLGALRPKVRMALCVALGLGVPLSLLVAIHAPSIMDIFGHEYAAAAAGALRILALTYVATVVRQLYVAISRVLGRVRRASFFALLTGAAELAAATAGGYWSGLTGLALALAAVIVLQAAFMAPTVLSVVRPGRP